MKTKPLGNAQKKGTGPVAETARRVLRTTGLVPFFWAIVLTFCCALCLAPTARVDGQQSKPALAKVTIAGRKLAASSDAKADIVILDGIAKTKVKNATFLDVKTVQKHVLDAHDKLTADFKSNVMRLLDKKDFEGIKAAEKTFDIESDALLDNLGLFTVEGTLEQVVGELQIAGKLREYAYKGADKAIGKDKTLVEGTAMQVKAKDNQVRLAIFNGDRPILVSGKAAEGHANSQGMIRVYGVLRRAPTAAR